MNDFIAMSADRRVRCELIAAKVRAMGYACDWQKVNRNFGWFKRWDESGLAFGYVIRRTGLRRLSELSQEHHDAQMDVTTWG